MSLPTCQTELRHLSPQARRYIEARLDDSYSWRDLIGIIPKRLDPLSDADDERPNEDADRVVLLIDNAKYQLLENQLHLKNGSPSRALLDYWSTYGVRRPTVEHLLYYAARCKLNRLVNYLLFEVVQVQLGSAELGAKTRNFLINSFFFDEQQDERLRQFIDRLVSESDFGQQKERNDSNRTDQCGAQKETDFGVRSLPYDLVRRATNDFNKTSLKGGGNKLGQGGFGAVYLAKIARSDLPDEQLDCELDYTGSHYLVAVKVVANEFRNQFLNELKYLAEFRHPNLLNLIGLSQYRDTLCILSEYMINGSLHDCLPKTNVRTIDYGQRIAIIGQIIDAVCHLHTFRPGNPLVHRDITSNNILLDRQFNSKLCDFGLARLLSSNGETQTSNAIGTSCYMPMESLRGTISVKTDTFSFGVVLLEILTGLPPIIRRSESESTDILSFMAESVFDEDDEDEVRARAIEHLDRGAGAVDEKVAVDLFCLAKRCTDDYKARPTMVEVRTLFEQIRGF